MLNSKERILKLCVLHWGTAVRPFSIGGAHFLSVHVFPAHVVNNSSSKSEFNSSVDSWLGNFTNVLPPEANEAE